MTVIKLHTTRTPRRSEALPVRWPPFVEAERRLSRFMKWWNGHEYGDTDSSEREAEAWGETDSAFIAFIATTPAFTAAGVLAKLRAVVDLSDDLGVGRGEDFARTMLEALERLAKGGAT